MPVFGRYVSVEIVQAPGTAEERRWSTRIGGDLAAKALLHVPDRVKTGDHILGEFFDEPRVISSVRPVTALDGTLTHWEAAMVPLSQWNRANRPPGSQYIASGPGARINVGSIDQSLQQFHSDPELKAVERELGSLRAAIEQLAHGHDRENAVIDFEQLAMELRRPKPESSRIWTLVERLTALGGLAEKAAKLRPLLARLLEPYAL